MPYLNSLRQKNLTIRMLQLLTLLESRIVRVQMRFIFRDMQPLQVQILMQM